MLPKNKEKLKRKERRTWVEMFPRKTPTKQELQRRIIKKHKAKLFD